MGEAQIKSAPIEIRDIDASDSQGVEVGDVGELAMILRWLRDLFHALVTESYRRK